MSWWQIMLLAEICLNVMNIGYKMIQHLSFIKPYLYNSVNKRIWYSKHKGIIAVKYLLKETIYITVHQWTKQIPAGWTFRALFCATLSYFTTLKNICNSSNSRSTSTCCELADQLFELFNNCDNDLKMCSTIYMFKKSFKDSKVNNYKTLL